MRQRLLPFVSALLVLIAAAAAALFLVPKYALFERLLHKTGALAIADQTREGPLNLTYLNGTIFFKSAELRFSKLELKTLPPRAELLCPGGGGATARPFWGGVKVEIDLTCLSVAKRVRGTLTLTPGGLLYGNLTALNATVEGVNLPQVRINFKGQKATYTVPGSPLRVEIDLRGG